MKNTPLHSTSSDGMIQVTEPERGHFAEETIKGWATEVLFVEEGIASAISRMSLEEAIEILHKYNFAKIKV